MDGETDIKRLLAGERGAWPAFVRRHAPIIYAAINRQLRASGRLDDAEDVAQDVFVRLCAKEFRLLREFDPGRARLTTWLTVIATSAAIDHLRRRKRTTEPLDDMPEHIGAVQAVEQSWIKIPPDLLSPRQALVLRMLYDQDLDVAEAAKLLAVDPQTVRSMHHKALTKLRAHFQHQENPPAPRPAGIDEAEDA